MKPAALCFVSFYFAATPALAQDVGIQFSEMEIGTTLLTQSLSGSEKIKSQKFAGKQGNFYVLEESYRNADDSYEALGNTYFDLEGREVKADWHDGPAYYSPYSCMYAVGNCKQTLDYPNPNSNNETKRTVSNREYNNRLEDDTLIVTWRLAGGKVHEVPYTLGPYNFRISSRYETALGELRGHKLIELVEPTSSAIAAPLKSVEVDKAEMVNCDAVYARLKKNAPGDTSVCKVEFAEPKFQSCELPEKFSAERPASHVVLILDASGSMAGKAGGKSKMQVAKEEALSFLDAIQDDVPVGLMVYGHRGDNTEAGKEASCSAVEWAHKIGASKSALSKSINDLAPTGWTPLGGALAFAGQELSKVKRNKDDEVSVPVVYLLSDGKETCGGNAVDQARSLQKSGVRATINVIGFGVDAETRAELEAISEAGGGGYFPADDAAALRKQLRAIRESEASKYRYNFCQLVNLGQINSVYHNAGVKLAGCVGRELNRDGIYAMLKQIKEVDAAGGPEKSCVPDIRRRAYADHSEMNKIANTQFEILNVAREKGLADFYADSRFQPLEK